MSNKSQLIDFLNSNLNLDHLDSGQIRVLRTLIVKLANTMQTEQESVYFEGSAESLRLCASLIKQSNFITAKQQAGQSEVPYAEQVLEYSLDVLGEHQEKSKIVTYDN